MGLEGRHRVRAGNRPTGAGSRESSAVSLAAIPGPRSGNRFTQPHLGGSTGRHNSRTWQAKHIVLIHAHGTVCRVKRSSNRQMSTSHRTGRGGCPPARCAARWSLTQQLRASGLLSTLAAQEREAHATDYQRPPPVHADTSASDHGRLWPGMDFLRSYAKYGARTPEPGTCAAHNPSPGAGRDAFFGLERVRRRAR